MSGHVILKLKQSYVHYVGFVKICCIAVGITYLELNVEKRECYQKKLIILGFLLSDLFSVICSQNMDIRKADTNSLSQLML